MFRPGLSPGVAAGREPSTMQWSEAKNVMTMKANTSVERIAALPSIGEMNHTQSGCLEMVEREEQHQNEARVLTQSPKDDMMSCLMALEAALLPCLSTRGFQLIDRSPQPSHQINVERHAKEFMETAKKLQLYFIGLQREDLPTNAEKLRKEIAVMEEELEVKNEIIKKNERLIQGWKKELKDQLDRHNNELDKV